MRAITLLSFPINDPETAAENEFLAALVFFLVAACIMFLNAIFQVILSKNDFAIYYLDWYNNLKFLRKRKNELMASPILSELDKKEFGLLTDRLKSRRVSIA